MHHENVNILYMVKNAADVLEEINIAVSFRIIQDIRQRIELASLQDTKMAQFEVLYFGDSIDASCLSSKRFNVDLQRSFTQLANEINQR
jgi:hypothetical protein